mgnify:CR=1 FL=1
MKIILITKNTIHAINACLKFSLKALNKIKVEKCLIKIYEQGISEKISVRAVSLVGNPHIYR